MNETFDCVSRDILVPWNISLLINHVLDRSYNKDIKAAGRLLPVGGRGGGGHFVEGFIIKILFAYEDHGRKGVRYLWGGGGALKINFIKV